MQLRRFGGMMVLLVLLAACGGTRAKLPEPTVTAYEIQHPTVICSETEEVVLVTGYSRSAREGIILYLSEGESVELTPDPEVVITRKITFRFDQAPSRTEKEAAIRWAVAHLENACGGPCGGYVAVRIARANLGLPPQR